MVVKNFKCLRCENIEICKAYAALKKFDADSARTPFPVDITIDDCSTYKESSVSNNPEDLVDEE